MSDNLIPVGFKPDVGALYTLLGLDNTKTTVFIDDSCIPENIQGVWGVVVINQAEGFEYRLDILHEDMPQDPHGWTMTDVYGYIVDNSKTFSYEGVEVAGLMQRIARDGHIGRFEMYRTIIESLENTNCELYTPVKDWLRQIPSACEALVGLDGNTQITWAPDWSRRISSS